jgi:hypothetical protein
MLQSIMAFAVARADMQPLAIDARFGAHGASRDKQIA